MLPSPARLFSRCAAVLLIGAVVALASSPRAQWAFATVAHAASSIQGLAQ